jgi:cytidine deaminase
MDYAALLEQAREAAKHAIAVVSKYRVGAALVSGGDVFVGCNVEFSRGTVCAERTVLVKAISEGARTFQALAVFSLDGFDTWPCGTCRQMLFELAPDVVVITQSEKGDINTMHLRELLPQLI